MIYFTTFILTLLLSHIARATPSCGDPASPEELYDPTYVDAPDAQNALPNPFFQITWSSYYDNKNGDSNKVACSTGPHGIASRYPHFKDIPGFPNIGGAYFIKWGSPLCGTCWNLTNVKAHKTVFITLIDSAKTGVNISKEAFTALNGGKPGPSLQALVNQVPLHFCRHW